MDPAWVIVECAHGTQWKVPLEIVLANAFFDECDDAIVERQLEQLEQSLQAMNSSRKSRLLESIRRIRVSIW